jgi:serine/threonine-protein kinase
MGNDACSDATADSGFERVLADYLEVAAADRAERDRWIAAHPEHAEALRGFVDDVDRMRRLAGPVSTRKDEGDSESPSLLDGNDGRTVGEVGESTDDPAATATFEMGRYIGWSPHAKGGLGEVFTATDTELHRVVALKRLQERHAQDARSQRHFLLEAEVTARLDHPGVVPVHSLFQDGSGRPCYTMRFIEGQTLEDAVRAYHAGPPDPVAFRRLLQSLIQVCETIAYAHSRGVIHRDIKPKNIMLGKFGETIVVDWGLAKVVGRGGEEARGDLDATLRPVSDSSLDRTEMGAAVGTIPYMSPEQAAGRWDVIDASSDVYNLGSVLYELLTGRPKLESGNWPELQQKIQRGEFPRPSSVKPGVPRALEAICLKAMAQKPEDRYQSALALAAEIELWLADEPVKAYREPIAGHLRRWARRHKVLAASGAVALILLLVSHQVVQRTQAQARHHVNAMQLTSNARALGELTIRHNELETSARATLDRMAARLVHDPRLNHPELQPLRGELLGEALGFWDEAIEHDTKPGRTPGGRASVYRRQRAICLAQLGEHAPAAAEAASLGTETKENERSGDVAYDLARVYALCAAASRDDRGLAKHYADRSMEFLGVATRADVDKNFDLASLLNHHPDFDALRAREDFRELIRAVEAKGG